MSALIIAIDGPSGAGKSTVSKILSDRLGIIYIDTGAMYRAVALKSKRRGVAPDDFEGLGEVALSSKITFKRMGGENRTFLDGEDVSEEIRHPHITMLTSKVSQIPLVRSALMKLQRKIALASGVIMDGRDIGSVVFPGADYKFYLDADIKERGKRRHIELKEKNLHSEDLSLTVKGLEARDKADSERAVAPLRKAEGAIYIDTTGLSINEVVEILEVEIKKNESEK